MTGQIPSNSSYRSTSSQVTTFQDQGRSGVKRKGDERDVRIVRSAKKARNDAEQSRQVDPVERKFPEKGTKLLQYTPYNHGNNNDLRYMNQQESFHTRAYKEVFKAMYKQTKSDISFVSRVFGTVINPCKDDRMHFSRFCEAANRYKECIEGKDDRGAEQAAIDAEDEATSIWNKDIQDANGNTMMHIACQLRISNVARYLLSAVNLGSIERCVNYIVSGGVPNVDLLIENNDGKVSYELADWSLSRAIKIIIETRDGSTLQKYKNRRKRQLDETMAEIKRSNAEKRARDPRTIFTHKILNGEEIPESLYNVFDGPSRMSDGLCLQKSMWEGKLLTIKQVSEIVRTNRNVKNLWLPDEADNSWIEEIVKIGLPNLENIQMYSSSIDDNGLKMLSGMESLKSISLGYSPLITDAGLLNLAKMPNLSWINAQSEGITRAGFMKFAEVRNKAGLPAMSI